MNNAGILRDRMLFNMSEAEWDAVITVHLKGHAAPTRHACGYWRERSKAGEQVDASIVCTSSTSGLLGNAGQSNYGAAKAGIAAFTVISAIELGRYGVTVNCLAPNARTRLTEQTFGELAVPEGGFDAMDPGNISPLVVALVLGDATETALRQSLIMSDGSLAIFFTRPLAAPMMICALLLFCLPLIQTGLSRMRAREVEAVAAPGRAGARRPRTRRRGASRDRRCQSRTDATSYRPASRR